MNRESVEIAIDKATLRKLMVSRRRSLATELRTSMNSAIARHVIGLPEVVNARHLHIYLSIPAFVEVDTAPIINGLAVMDKKFLVPVIQKDVLVSALFRKGDAVVPGEFGQPEPAEYVIADESHIDVVLLPLLAFDERGYRLGYGKGLYDRFLRRLSEDGVNPYRIGLSFLQQMVEKVPIDHWDEPLDAVVHQEGIIRYT